MKIHLHQVDAFTDEMFGGNPAGVVTNADGLRDDQMRAIAREMNLSETAFVLKPKTKDADVKLRFFTPAGSEIKFCGHATVGTLYQLARLGLYGLKGKAPKPTRVETNAGVLEMSVSRDEQGEPQVTFAAPSVTMEPYHLQGKAFTSAFGIPAEALLPRSTILIDRELNYVYIPIRSLKNLSNLQFNFVRIRTKFGPENIIVFCLFTKETLSEDSNLHARGLAPLVGVDEDPFTGSSMAGLVRAAKYNKALQPGQQEILIEQGNFIGRPGMASIHHDPVTDVLTVTAKATQVFSTEVEV